MSRYDPRERPWLRAETVALWKKYREEHVRDWNHQRETIKDGVRSPDGHVMRCAYTPEPLHFDTRWFKQFKERPEALHWKDERVAIQHGYERVPTVRWTEEGLVVVVRQTPFPLEDWSCYGEFTDHEETAYYGDTWGTMLFVDRVLRKLVQGPLQRELGLRPDNTKTSALDAVWEALKEDLRKRVNSHFPDKLHKKTLRGPSSRHAWKVGCYDTFQGKTNHHDRHGKKRYIQLDGYDYDELRKMYWLLGHSKREADELARQEFRSRVAFMERVAEGEVYETLVEAKVYDETDADEEDELASDGVSTTVDRAYASERRYLDETAREVARQALAQARKDRAEATP
jgi:hypothetical protein